ncbi:hypothetical protein L1D29_13785 [Shewanella insulae]|uniref:hypothetical protein n=1 Tax=Shewanella insulae TaxID=2681496 RepID=UPI001EFEA91B|nr:hypothetical protein [Shewanella insulae]MCG9713889.1 hypothetical protein [Shewanella insulae]
MLFTAVSRQPSAVSRQPSAVSRQPSAVSRQPSAVSRQSANHTLFRRSCQGSLSLGVIHLQRKSW